MVKIVFDQAIYDEGLVPAVQRARRSLWIATANLKDLQLVSDQGVVPLWSELVRLAGRGVDVRVIHSGAISERMKETVAESVHTNVKLMCCQRNHMKCLIMDGFELFLGSANLTGAGMGAKAAHRRNFEAGILTRELDLVRAVQRRYVEIWSGVECAACRFSSLCVNNREDRG